MELAWFPCVIPHLRQCKWYIFLILGTIRFFVKMHSEWYFKVYKTVSTLSNNLNFKKTSTSRFTKENYFSPKIIFTKLVHIIIHVLFPFDTKHYKNYSSYTNMCRSFWYFHHFYILIQQKDYTKLYKIMQDYIILLGSSMLLN